MAQEPLSNFHEHLLLFLQNDLQQKKNEEGWDEHSDSEMRQFCDILTKSIRTPAPLQLQEIVERYQHLFSIRGPVHLEHKLLQAFNEKEMQQLGLAPLKMMRGLPRLYRKDRPAENRIKPRFAHLPSLKRTAAKRAIYSLYKDTPVPKDAKIALLCYVMNDGLGDLYAAVETARLIKRSFPYLEPQIFALSQRKLAEIKDCTLHAWTGSDKQIDLLRGFDLILEIPTPFPEKEAIRKRIEELDDPRAVPSWESVGEYGFIESDAFHPRSGAHCMGLHFLEVGLLLPTLEENPWPEPVAKWLFGQLCPGPQEIEEYRAKRRFFLGYFYSQEGIYLYLHALLKSLEWDHKEIDLCVPDASKLLAYLAERVKEGKEIFERPYGVKQVVLQIGGHIAVKEWGGEGKILRIFCPETLTGSDFQKLLAFSEEFVACRGNRSFSEVVQYNKGFFYDSREHSGPFVKDLIALAENRIPLHRSTLGILRLFLKQPSVQEGDWVDESALQAEEAPSLLERAEAMGHFLQDPDALAGFKKLNRILSEEYSCNAFLVQLVQRALFLRKRAALLYKEEEELCRFALGRQSLTQTIRKLQDALAV